MVDFNMRPSHYSFGQIACRSYYDNPIAHWWPMAFPAACAKWDRAGQAVAAEVVERAAEVCDRISAARGRHNPVVARALNEAKHEIRAMLAQENHKHAQSIPPL